MRVIAGTARRLQLTSVPGPDVRPTTDKIKETLFNILAPRIAGCAFLDLFSGSGAIGIEALSRGASHSYFVESDRRALTCIRQNLAHTRLTEGAVVLPLSVFAALPELRRAGKTFDFIYMDPPYGKELEKRALRMLSSTCLVSEETEIIVEADLATDFSYVRGLGLEIFRQKKYKTNQHVFLRRDGEAEENNEEERRRKDRHLSGQL